MTRATVVLAMLLMPIGVIACGENGDEPYRFGDWTDVPETESHDWIVEGMSCAGEEVIRMVGVFDEEVRYLRGDDCVDEGDPFWEEAPQSEGNRVEVLVDSQGEEFVEMVIDVESENYFSLDGVDGDEVYAMRRVFPEVNPTAIPGLSDFDLAGQWLMTGYPCFEEEVPQLVRIIDPPAASIHANKIIGDECVSDGEAFLDAEISESLVTGSPKLHDDWEFGEVQSSSEGSIDVEAIGSVRTENFIRLDILDQAVDFRRVLD
jgi:hypothetical protein